MSSFYLRTSLRSCRIASNKDAFAGWEHIIYVVEGDARKYNIQMKLSSQHKFILAGTLAYMYILVEHMACLPSLLVYCQACWEISEATQLLIFQQSLMVCSQLNYQDKR